MDKFVPIQIQTYHLLEGNLPMKLGKEIDEAYRKRKRSYGMSSSAGYADDYSAEGDDLIFVEEMAYNGVQSYYLVGSGRKTDAFLTAIAVYGPALWESSPYSKQRSPGPKIASRLVRALRLGGQCR